MRRNWLFIVPLAITGLVVFTFLGGQVVMRLWNWLLPSLFGLHAITFWQALGLLVLCRILFGNIGGGMRHGPRSDARREKLREALRRKFGTRAPGAQGEAL